MSIFWSRQPAKSLEKFREVSSKSKKSRQTCEKSRQGLKSLAKVYFSLAYPYKGALLQHSAPEGSYVDQSERSGYTFSVKSARSPIDCLGSLPAGPILCHRCQTSSNEYLGKSTKYHRTVFRPRNVGKERLLCIVHLFLLNSCCT